MPGSFSHPGGIPSGPFARNASRKVRTPPRRTRADRDVADAVVAVLRRSVLRRVARPRGERDLAAQPGVRRAEHRGRLLLVERLELVNRRVRHLRPPPEHDRAVLLVVNDRLGLTGARKSPRPTTASSGHRRTAATSTTSPSRPRAREVGVEVAVACVGGSGGTSRYVQPAASIVAARRRSSFAAAAAAERKPRRRRRRRSDRDPGTHLQRGTVDEPDEPSALGPLRSRRFGACTRRGGRGVGGFLATE